jgi:hypothetical protein
VEVAVPVVRMMQVSVDEVVHVIAMGHGRVTASDAVHVRRIVPTAPVRRRAGRGIGVGDIEAMLLDHGPILMVQMPVVQIVDVPVVQDPGVPATRAVGVRMIGVM